MSSATDYLETQLLNHYRGTRLVLPATYFIALHTADPTDAAGAEVALAAWPSYARQEIGYNWSAPVVEGTPPEGAAPGMQIANNVALDFPPHNGAAPVAITHFSVWDAATGGNMWNHAPLETAKTLDPTDIFTALAGALKLIAR